MPSIVTLCGSTKFKETFMEVNKNFTLEGLIVLMPGVFANAENQILTDEEINKLNQLHKEKIKMSDFVFIVDVNHYIGQSTLSEIEFAKSIGKEVIFLSDLKENMK